jgi:hypothetical protein
LSALELRDPLSVGSLALYGAEVVGDPDHFTCLSGGGMPGTAVGGRPTPPGRPGRLHDVRHTAATHLLTRGVPVHIVSARLGHSTPVVTLNVYAHVLPTSDEQAAEVMAAVVAG